MGYHKASKALGVKYLLESPVTGITVKDRRITALRTTTGDVRAERVVFAAGAWSNKLGEMIGLAIPVEPVRRQCLVTHPIREGMNHPIPMTIDYATGVYMHSESGGVLIGLADKNEPPSFNETADPEFIMRMVELAMARVPVLEQASILTQWGGLYEVTPDHHPILGALPGLANATIAAGFSGHGVMHAPATGQLVAEMLLEKKTSLDVSCLRYSRFQEGALIHESHVI
jgi:sarcosine oxidase subunit beta